MYKYFNASDEKHLFETTKRLKAICEKDGDERLFYKTWGNEAIFTSNKKNRHTGLEMAKDIQEYAKKHDSKYGLYVATYLSGSILSNIHQYDNAKAHLEKALEYKNLYLPDENAASIYITLARIELNNNEFDKTIDYTQKVIDDSKSIPTHKSAASSLKCLAYVGKKDTTAFFNAYKEHEKIKEKYGASDNIEPLVNVYEAMHRKDYEEAIKRADKIPTRSISLSLKAVACAEMKDYKGAYYYHKQYKAYMDSINSNETQRKAYEYAAQLDVTRSENESKNLRLRNQQLKINQQQNELQKRKLEDEAVKLKLRNADIELANAAARRDNDSLTAYNQRLQISEYQSKMEAQEHAARARKMREKFIIIIGLIAVATLAYLYWRRRKQIKKLKAINQQLTELEKAEREARLEAEHALQVKKNFIQNISHEVRTPLNSIYGFTQILTMPGIDLPQEEKEKLCERIGTSTNILTDVMDKMIELSHFDSMKKVEKNDDVSIDELCRKVAARFEAPAAEKHLTIRIDNRCPEGTTIKTNRECLEKVFTHLMDNAIKFTNEGSITIQAKNYGSQTRFAIADTGVGIPEENQPMVFEPFFDTGEQVKTTGMGLSICRTICRLLGGDISIERTDSTGTTIAFHIDN